MKMGFLVSIGQGFSPLIYGQLTAMFLFDNQTLLHLLHVQKFKKNSKQVNNFPLINSLKPVLSICPKCIQSSALSEIKSAKRVKRKWIFHVGLKMDLLILFQMAQWVH